MSFVRPNRGLVGHRQPYIRVAVSEYMAKAPERARSITHVEYRLLQQVLNNIDVASVRDLMVDDSVTEKRFQTAGKNVASLIKNLIDRRLHRLPEDHPDYTPKED